MSIFSSNTASLTWEMTWDQLTLLDYDKDLQLRENMKTYYETWGSLAKSASNHATSDTITVNL